MTDMQDWTQWSGGDRPHPPETHVRVRYRDGTEDEGQSAFARWWHDNGEPERDIIAFRLAPTAPVEASGSELTEEIVRSAYLTYTNYAEFPYSKSAMREAIEVALKALGHG